MKSNFKNIVNADKPVLVDFFADWCGPCKMLIPVLAEVKKELGDAIKIIKVDVDKNKSLADQFQVRGVPTLILFKKGKKVWRQSGVLQKADLIQIIKSS
ncbi:thioredoxin [Nonlabens sp.]|uniref:thioredoxin n=1 Tax=Nonlabens sp. TaxID=1888209 RepID=UPI0025D763E1|nr:thioredoxin [Nonlabens sp.]